MAELTVSALKKAQHKANKKSININKALGLPYYIVRKGYLYLIRPDGSQERIKKAVFGLQKAEAKKIVIKNAR